MELEFFFLHVSRAQCLAPATRRLEAGLSNPEPSALTTGLLNKAVALAPCPVVHPNFFGLMGYYYFV